jgi:hypothetical protein
MGEGRSAVGVLCGSWGDDHDETAFVMRSLAAAASRIATVSVLVPGPKTAVCPDGAFDLLGVGGVPGGDRRCGRWPEASAATWPDTAPFALALTEGRDEGAIALVEAHLPGVPVARVLSCVADGSSGAHGASLAVGLGSAPEAGNGVGLHVPAHRLATARGHVGIGFTDYLLVLADRGPGAATTDRPTPLAAWLAARFAGRHVVVIENGLATVWRSRSLRGVITVDTRTDLWRLLAHARLTVDLSPGPLIARECVESLLYGVPVVVPADTAGARLAALGGGLWFRDEAELLGCVEALDDQAVRDTLGEQGLAEAARWYGDPGAFVRRVAGALEPFGVGPGA